MEWQSMSPAKRKTTVGYLVLVIGRFVMPIFGVALVGDGYGLSRAEAILGMILTGGGLAVGFVGLLLVIYGAVKDDLPGMRKAVQILLVIGIYIGGWIGAACLFASLIVNLSAKKKSKMQDEQEVTRW